MNQEEGEVQVIIKEKRLCQNVGTTFFLRFTVLLYFLLLMMLFSDSFGKTLLSSTCSGL